MSKVLTISLSLAALIALGACGGAGPVEQPVVVPIVEDVTEDEPVPVDEMAPILGDLGTDVSDEVDPANPLLLATLAAIDADETAINSVALVTDAATGARSVLTRDGLYARIDETLSLADLVTDVNSDVLGDYDNAASFSQADAVGVVGLATSLADLRITGDASFEGGAAGFVITGDDGVDLIKGRSVVNIAFGVGKVTVTLDNFEGVSQISGLVVDSPVTEMVLRNADISGGEFSGGTLSLWDAGGSIDVTGADTKTLSQGQFFGLDSDGITPDEVGGLILSEGASGIVYGTFIAD